MINAPYKGGKDFDPVPAGNHIARCYQIIHVGTVPGEYMGQPIMTNKVRFTFELPNETKIFKEGDAPKPFSISQEYTLSMGEKSNLRKAIQGWIGTSLLKEEAEFFDVEEMIGKPCMLNVVHKTSKKGSVYALVQGIAPIPKGIEAPAQINPSKIFNYTNHFDQATFDALPKFLKEVMEKSEEYKALKNPMQDGEVNPDEIPF